MFLLFKNIKLSYFISPKNSTVVYFSTHLGMENIATNHIHRIRSTECKSRKCIAEARNIRLKKFFPPVIMYGCESWTIKKVERQRIDAFELWCWRRLESPLGSKEIQPVHPKGNESCVLFRGFDVETETPML